MLTEPPAVPTATSRSPSARAQDVRIALVASGGVATRAELAAATSQRALRTALAQGLIERARPGVYRLPEVPLRASRSTDAGLRALERAERVGAHRRTAIAAGGVLSHRSAAEYHGLPLLAEPSLPEFIVPRGRRLSQRDRAGAVIRYRSLEVGDYAGGVTTPLRTVLDCLADLPFAQALAVADSGLRAQDDHDGLVGPTELASGADRAPRPVRSRVRRIADLADGSAANPMESAMRALAVQVPGTCWRTQVPVRCGDATFRVDAADVDLRIALEADSYEWHATRDGHARDCLRYSTLVAHGWLVLRFTWSGLTVTPEQATDLIAATVDLRRRSGHADS